LEDFLYKFFFMPLKGYQKKNIQAWVKELRTRTQRSQGKLFTGDQSDVFGVAIELAEATGKYTLHHGLKYVDARAFIIYYGFDPKKRFQGFNLYQHNDGDKAKRCRPKSLSEIADIIEGEFEHEFAVQSV
jgi:hypothetical protein